MAKGIDELRVIEDTIKGHLPDGFNMELTGYNDKWFEVRSTIVGISMFSMLQLDYNLKTGKVTLNHGGTNGAALGDVVLFADMLHKLAILGLKLESLARFLNKDK